MLTKDEIDFILSHADDDTSKLLFAGARYENIDVRHMVSVILARRKIKEKLPEWYAAPGLDFPSSISVEQCSSQATALYKQQFINQGYKVADLTGGLGVDSWALSRKASSLTYIERNKELFETVRSNFSLLNCNNIICLNCDSVDFLDNPDLKQFDLIYIDPARRDKSAKRVYSIADCEPDLLEIKEKIYRLSPVILAKVSPMADIAHTLEQFPDCREIHIVAVNNECKELLLYLEKGYCGTTEIIASNIAGNHIDSFRFSSEEEKNASAIINDTLPKTGDFLYQPNKAILKAGAFKLISSRFSLKKLSVNSHIYISGKLVADFPGRIFRINEVIPFNKEGIKHIQTGIRQADCFAVNFPLDTASLTKKLNLKAGGDTFLIATTLSSGDKTILSLNRL